MIGFIIRLIPTYERLYWNFDENKSYNDLKNDIFDRAIIKNGECYIDINDQIINDDTILKVYGVEDYYDVKIVRSDYIKIKLEIFSLMLK